MRTKTLNSEMPLWKFALVIILGFILFAIPNVFFHVTKFNGGFTGINLLFAALFIFITVTALIRIALLSSGKTFADIGFTTKQRGKDAALGLTVGLTWTIIQFSWLIPATGGADRKDIQQMLQMMDGTWIGLVSYIALGVLAGGITEEIYNRGFFIKILQDKFHNKKLGIYVAACLSIIFFAAGHLPTNGIEVVDIIIPTIAYTLLFLYTESLIAPMVAHSVYNLLAILSTYYLYAQ